MKRQAHYLKAVAGGTIPRSILSVAVAGKFGCGGIWAAYHNDGADRDNEGDCFAWGSEPGEFWRYLSALAKQTPGTWVVFCGACEQITALGFWELLEERSWEIADNDKKQPAENIEAAKGMWAGLAVLDDPPTIIVCRKSGQTRTVKIIDCRNYGVSGWSSLYAGPLSSRDAREEATNKAFALTHFMRALVRMVKINRLGSLKATAASQAMHAYRHRFMPSMILAHDNQVAIGLERSALYGGRNECWRTGKVEGLTYHLDFNSFYPSVVIGAMMPARLRGHVLGCSPHPQELMEAGYQVISEVTVDARLPCYPVRFSRQRHVRGQLHFGGQSGCSPTRDGDLVYPVGRYTTALCGPELSLAIDRGEVRLIHGTSWYEPAELFTQWGSEAGILAEQARNHGSKALEEFVKRLRNSLFGKFGQWLWTWEPAPWQASDHPYKLWYGEGCEGEPSARYRSLGWSCQVEKRAGESAESCPAITAWVYSLARAKMWSALECAGLDNVYYMDADSIWCNQTGYAALEKAYWLHSTLPGKLKVKGMFTDVHFYGLKMYSCGDKQIHAGVPDGTPGNHKTGWTYYSPEKVMPALALKRAPAQIMVPHRVKIEGKYRHGIVTVGGRVLPFTLNEE